MAIVWLIAVVMVGTAKGGCAVPSSTIVTFTFETSCETLFYMLIYISVTRLKRF